MSKKYVSYLENMPKMEKGEIIYTLYNCYMLFVVIYSDIVYL